MPIAVVMNEQLNAFEQRRKKMVDDSDENGKNKTQISKVKVFIALQAMKFWYVFRKVHGNMPWVLYRERKLAIERELESEMRSFEAKAFDGKNMGMWSKQKHKNARHARDGADLVLQAVFPVCQGLRSVRWPQPNRTFF